MTKKSTDYMSQSTKNILSGIKYSYKLDDIQTNLFTCKHKKYLCTIDYRNKKITQTYQCVPELHGEPDVIDFMEALLWDADSYECAPNVEDFIFEFGFAGNAKDLREGFKTYDSCKNTSEALHSIFTKKTLDILKRDILDYDPDKCFEDEDTYDPDSE